MEFLSRKRVSTYSCRTLSVQEDWTSFWTNMIHHDPKDEGGELDESSRLLESFADGFDHVDDIISPSVDSTVGASSISNLRSLLRPAKVGVMAMILATICGVRVVI